MTDFPMLHDIHMDHNEAWNIVNNFKWQFVVSDRFHTPHPPHHLYLIRKNVLKMFKKNNLHLIENSILLYPPLHAITQGH